MPALLELTQDGRGYIMKCSGILTFSDIFDIKQKIDASPHDISNTSFWLVDLRDVKEIRLESSDVHQIVHMDRKLAQKMPHAAVAIVAPNDVAFGVSRMWEILAEDIGWPTGVFRKIQDAELWVNARLAHSHS